MNNLIKKNQIFGYWKVLGETNDNPLPDEFKYYRCRCTCGNEKDVRAESLINKLSTSCGCRRQKRRKEFNVGTKFGSWEIVNSIFNSNKNDMYYYCECKRCGAEIEGFHSQLYKKMKNTCSCNLGSEGFKKGCRYGDWSIVRPGSKGAKKSGDRYYLCRCDCGTEREVVDSSLRKMLSTSCGCSRVNSQKKVVSLIGWIQPLQFSGDITGNWRVIRKDDDKKIYECINCEVKLEVKLGTTHKKCPICSHSKDIDKEKMMQTIIEEQNLNGIEIEKLYFVFCIITEKGRMKYILSDGVNEYEGNLNLARKRKGHPIKNSPIITSKVSQVIDELKLNYDEKYIVEHKNDLHPLLKDMDEWDLTKILLQGYFVEGNIYK
ncbi:hypothetical protein [Lysinibacillus sphaericus]|uniref:hypothetical protein n=1 Tax=Lysinibacillus sphaericus TaxID=1421 RepID=UPI000C19A728|nr:hypothetical protein [Lysinibacillus sphaericus]PIJ97978.1 hypothetical protein CTN02_09545 [Lysinibacillus sphaericus]